MKLAFAGSPDFALPALKKIIECGHEVVAVITQPDKPCGRKRVLTPTPVKEYAFSVGLRVFDFQRVREHVKELKELDCPVLVTCAYGQLLTQEVLDCFKDGVWNIHASLLPKFRGASPIQSAILAGEEYTGVTVMRTELALDAGDILLVKRCETGNLTCGELSKKLSLLGAEAIAEGLPLIESGAQLLMQDESKATFCKKVSKADGKINFNDCPQHICRLIKAFSPEPAAFCNFSGQILNIFDAEPANDKGGKCGEVVAADKSGITVACKDGAILLKEVQLAGGKRMRGADLVNGRKIKVGDFLE